jgi:molybdopterin molybdotransferase
VVQEVRAGDPPPERELSPGEAMRVLTGGPLPRGAALVVQQEQTEREGDRLRIRADQPLQAGLHVRRRGEELSRGQVALPAGALLGPAELSLFAAACTGTVVCHRRPRVALLATGHELVAPGQEPGPGQIVDSSTLVLEALARAAGALTVRLGIGPDDPGALAARLLSAEADVLVTTGGASVGDHDHARASLERLGGALVFHGVAIRPGKPALFGTAPSADRGASGGAGLRPEEASFARRRAEGDGPEHPEPGVARMRGASGGERLLFGLPGNPASSTLGFHLFVLPALRRLLGHPSPDPPRARAVLRGELQQVPGLTALPRGRAFLEGSRLCFSPKPSQGSMSVGGFVGVNALACLPPGEGLLSAGAELDVVLVGSL